MTTRLQILLSLILPMIIAIALYVTMPTVEELRQERLDNKALN